MARIFVAMYNFCRKPDDFEAMPPFYESFINGLKCAGNQVLCFHHKTFKRAFENEIPDPIRQLLKDFNPELCILFNNSFWDISKIVECPIVIYDVDSPLMFAHKDLLKDEVDRYKFVINQTKGSEIIGEQFGASPKQICYIPFFTEISASTVTPTKNIVFLGANWLYRGLNFLPSFLAECPDIKDREYAQKVLKNFSAHPFTDAVDIYDHCRFHPHQVIKLGDINRAAFEISGLKRIHYLRAIVDLGLEIRGSYWTASCMNYFPELQLAFNNVNTFTKQENEDFYNSAKIAINTKHIQAVSGFSFRVCDILASNACLVTEEANDLATLFEKAKIPSFTSSVELREQCLRLLNNENERQEIVLRAHEIIDEKFRFKNVLDKLESFLNINLRSDEEGNLKIFSDEGGEDCYKYKDNVSKEVNKESLKFKIGIHFGYDPLHYRPSKYISVGKIKLLKIINLPQNERHIYAGYIPLISLITNNGGLKVQLLPWIKFKKLCHWLFKKYKINIFRILYALPRLLNRINMRIKYYLGQPIKVCLFCSRISDWEFDGLYWLLEHSRVFKPFVVVKPFVSQGQEAMVEFMNQTYEALSKRGYRTIKTYNEENDEYINLRKSLKPDVIFYTMYWPPHFHKNYYINKFYDKVSFFTSYSFDCMEHPEVTNFEINNWVDMYFVHSELNKKWAQKNMDNRGKNVFLSGSPKLDILFDPIYQPKSVWKPQNKSKKRIIWAPHHSDHFPKWQYQCNSFYEICDDMITIAEKYKDEIQIAFKPHPMLKAKLIALWGKETTEAYYNKWATLENAQLEEGDFIDLFLTSDAMIMDSISFIAEYMAVNKPTLFTIGKTSRIFLNPFGTECFKFLYQAQGNLPLEIENFIQNVVINGNDIKFEERLEFVKNNIVPPCNQSASKNIYDLMCIKIFGKKVTI